ncbi:MAG: hypothetical protein ACPG6P_08050 [Akkermansiaceae bacterium]
MTCIRAIIAFSILLLPLAHAEEAITKSALSYLSKLAQDDFDLAKDTAISADCGDDRRQQIEDRLEFLYQHHLTKSTQFQSSEHKISGNLGAVIVQCNRPNKPLEINFISIAMLKRKGKWLAAPLPGVFTNTGYGYAASTEKTVRQLERWMALQKAKLQTSAKADATKLLLKNVATQEKNAALDSKNPEQAVLAFLTQCKEKNTTSALALLGAASNQLEDPLSTTLDMISRGFDSKDPASDWSLITHGDTISQIMKIDATRNEIAVGFYNPINRNKSKVFYFPYHKHEGKVFVRLASELKAIVLPQSEQWRAKWRNRRGDESTLAKSLPSTILKNIVYQPASTPKELITLLEKNLKTKDFTACLRLLPQDGKIFADKDAQKEMLFSFGDLWRTLAADKSSQFQFTPPMTDSNWALSIIQYTKNNRSSTMISENLWMHKTDKGWHILTDSLASKFSGEADKKIVASLPKKMKSLAEEEEKKLTARTLSKLLTLTPNSELKPITAEKAIELINTFRAKLRTKDVEAAMACCARFKDTSDPLVLKYFNYALRGALDHTPKDELIHSSANKETTWHCITLRTQSASTKLYDYPHYIVVNTTTGPRVVLDIDIRFPVNKGRSLLNAKNWRKIKASIPKPIAAELENLTEAANQVIEASLPKEEQKKP